MNKIETERHRLEMGGVSDIAFRHSRISGIRSVCLEATVVSLALLLPSAAPLWAESRSTILVQVTIGEEARMDVQGDNVSLRIRLAPGITAQVWSDAACDLPSSGSKTINRSGMYSIPLKELSQFSGVRICLQSSDAALRSSIPASRPGAIP